MHMLLFAALLLIQWTPGDADAQNFQLPIDCTVGEVCVVQNYADANPSAGAGDDPQCGPLSYDGHDGLDFRVPAALARRGVNVLAPAAGVVLGVRDGEPERAFLDRGAAAVADRECGNGVRIAHGGGWSTQLCHMRAGSLRVARGERVSAGQVLGLVGLSGQTEFPHVHLTLFRNERKIDPLTGGALADLRCGPRGADAGSHWSAAARQALAYRGARLFSLGFTGAAPNANARVEDLPANAAVNAPALVFWALASGPRDGDVLRVRLYGPDGALVGEGERIQPRDQAQASMFAGRRTPAGGWASGRYRGVAELLRDGRVLQTRTETMELR
ncbi:MAG: M23 family metallopeptidase [Terricaulis sp.]